MPTPIDAALSELDATERGFVLGLLLLGAADNDDATAPLLPPSRERCAEALAALRALPRGERLRATGAMARDAMAPLPAGIENVAVEQLRVALGGESAQTLALVAHETPAGVKAAARDLLAMMNSAGAAERAVDASVDSSLVAEVQRAALAAIVAVPPVSAAALPDRWDLRLAALSAAACLAEVTVAGARCLGFSLRGEDATIISRAARRVGPPWDGHVVAAASERVEALEGGEAGDDAAARACVAAVKASDDVRETLSRIGARALGTRFAGQNAGGLGSADLVVALAQRLPLAIGEELIAATKRSPVDPFHQ
jgi:hypothetical protein